MPSERVVHMDFAAIDSEERLHEEFSRVFGFPGWYGMNWNAWFDCMTCLDVPDDGMSEVKINPGDTLVLKISNFDFFAGKLPATAKALIEYAAELNEELMKTGSRFSLVRT